MERDLAILIPITQHSPCMGTWVLAFIVIAQDAVRTKWIQSLPPVVSVFFRRNAHTCCLGSGLRVTLAVHAAVANGKVSVSYDIMISFEILGF